MDKLYIETSIVSYATARPSRDITIAGLQQQARDWWANERHQFHLVTSQLTLDEAGDGDPTAAASRLELLAGLSLIDINADVVSLARRLIDAHTMPEKAAADSLHVAAAAWGGVKYLLTLNCRHIANAHELPRIYDLLDQEGLGQLLICTPAEFLGGQDEYNDGSDS
jgi:hypothetical protein